ncbi:MAG: hypothetical protein IPG50_34155 [Myxococcales bacterium]|nr:hypothetical protein [Myxococcales bacterium]
MHLSLKVAAAATALSLTLTTSAARAEGPLGFFELASSVEAGATLPTSSTQQKSLSLELLMPLVRNHFTRILAGMGPRAFTQQVVTMPELLGVGLASSLRAEF